MKILLLGCLFNEDEEILLLKKSKIGLSGAVNTYQWNLIKGLEKTLKSPIDMINVLPIGTYPNYFEDIILKTKKWSHSPGSNDLEIGSINLPLIKQVTRAIKCKRALKNWMSRDGNEKSIIIYSTYLPYLQAIKNIPSSELPHYRFASINPLYGK
jgi:hypothetical protein